MTLVETSRADHVMTITLNDPARRNALSAEMTSELARAFDAAERDDDVRVVVLTNRTSTFCAGADLSAVSSSGASPASPGVPLAELLGRVRRSAKPYVGRLAGHCVAGGVGLAAAMDVSIATSGATFGFSEVRVGVAPAIISVVCLPKMTRGAAREAFLRGRRFSAAEAVRVGLINHCAEPDELDAEVNAVVNDLLAGEPHALAVAKRLTDDVPAMGEEEAFAWTTRLSLELFQRPEAHEGASAFLQKRAASWVTSYDGAWEDPSAQ